MQQSYTSANIQKNKVKIMKHQTTITQLTTKSANLNR
jgi:hypothetical protein